MKYVIAPQRRGRHFLNQPPPQTNLQNWWTFRDPEDVTLVSGDISAVTDRMGNKDLQQTTSTSRPLHDATGINNLHTAVFVAGANEEYLESVSAWTGLTSSYAVAGIFQFTATSSATSIFTSTNQLEVGHNGSGAWRVETTSGSQTGGTSDTSAHYFVLSCNGDSTSNLRIDGSAVITADFTDPSFTDIKIAGEDVSVNRADVDVAEILIYSGALGGDLGLLESYLAGRSGV